MEPRTARQQELVGRLSGKGAVRPHELRAVEREVHGAPELRVVAEERAAHVEDHRDAGESRACEEPAAFDAVAMHEIANEIRWQGLRTRERRDVCVAA